jgi:hypothetical protein
VKAKQQPVQDLEEVESRLGFSATAAPARTETATAAAGNAEQGGDEVVAESVDNLSD